MPRKFASESRFIIGWYSPQTLIRDRQKLHFFAAARISICGQRAADVEAGKMEPTRDNVCAQCARKTGVK